MRKSRLDWATQSKLIELFVEGKTTRSAAESATVNKNTANTYFNRLRNLIYRNSQDPGFIEADIDGKNPTLLNAIDRAKTAHNIKPFGISFHGNHVYIAVLPENGELEKGTIIRQKAMPDYLFFYSRKFGKNCASLTHSKGRNSLRIHQCEYHKCPMKLACGENNFCSFFTEQQKQYFGIPEKHFNLYLKELEWKFNNPDKEFQKSELIGWALHELG